jgi:hypothetical protein
VSRWKSADSVESTEAPQRIHNLTAPIDIQFRWQDGIKIIQGELAGQR